MTSILVSGQASDDRQLSRFLSPAAGHRELIARRGACGSVLVIDRDAITHGDRRLVAHLAADEPLSNASLVAARYVEDVSRRACTARRMCPQDELVAPLEDELESDRDCAAEGTGDSGSVVGGRFRLAPEHGALSIPELRWRALAPSISEGSYGEIVSLRDVVGSLQSYEPALSVTRRALGLHRHARDLSTTVLRQEHGRLCCSPIVLNRCLREALLRTLSRGEVSMSGIAMRCGRVKRDSRGNASGETSWLARRVGLLPEGGATEPTPWIHSDVLALIARDGLGVSPREVEL
jgi:hypothetical protein